MDYLQGWEDNMKFTLTGKYLELSDVRGMRPHTGIDLAIPENTQLRSLFNGTVEQIYNNTGPIGNGVKIHAENGKHIIYGHMNNVSVHEGQHIDAGQLIGLSGNTGNSTGPHLHFGMQDSQGHFINPTDYADSVSNLSGNNFDTSFNLFPSIGIHPLDSIKEKAIDEISDRTIEIILGTLHGLGEFLSTFSLFATGLLIILKIVGFDKGYKWAGIIFTANVLIRYLFGGKMP
jgi:hypothetical protein